MPPTLFSLHLPPLAPLFLNPGTSSLPAAKAQKPILNPVSVATSIYLGRRCSFLCNCAANREVVNSVVGGGDALQENLPAHRSYEGDIAKLSLVGAVSLEQALTAAAADGGATAAHYLDSGTDKMVVETLFPGGPDEHSTISTRLFLSAKKVKEKAKKLRSKYSADIFSENDMSSSDVLAMTFRQVVLQRIWSFKLTVFSPGSERDMDNLSKPREGMTDFTVSSEDVKFLSSLAEAIYLCCLKDNKRSWSMNAGGMDLNIAFGTPQGSCSSDSSVCVWRIPENEVVKNALVQLAELDVTRQRVTFGSRKQKQRWWPAPSYNQLEKAGGPEFVAWANEFVPSYRLQIGASVFKNIKLEGWSKSRENRWEVLLTHIQMLDLGNIIDMYLEDQFTVSNKELPCGLLSEHLNYESSKSFWKKVLQILIGGSVIVALAIIAKRFSPHHMKMNKSAEITSVLSSNANFEHLACTDDAKLQMCCLSIVKIIKDELCWPGEIMVDGNVGAWVGPIPNYLKKMSSMSSASKSDHLRDTNCSREEEALPEYSVLRVPTSEEKNNSCLPKDGQDIASFQVVLLEDGMVVGVQPMSRVPADLWASNPLKKVLYKGHGVFPGYTESELQLPHTRKTVLIELLMSMDPESPFAFARPIKDPYSDSLDAR